MSAIFANIFLGCFLFGFVFTLASFLFGFDHGGGVGDHGGHFDLGDAGGHADVGHVDTSGIDGGTDISHDHSVGHTHQIPFFSLNGIMMFLTFFGGVGYVMNRNASGTVLIPLLMAIFAGLIGAGAIFLFMNKVLIRGETRMDPLDYWMPGTIARVTTRIRPDGYGEIVYEQGGTRKTAGARSCEEGIGHNQGEEVVIVRYEKGIAYVKSFASLSSEPNNTPA